MIDYDDNDTTNRIVVTFDFVYLTSNGYSRSYFLCMSLWGIYLDENGRPIIDEELFKEGRFYDRQHESSETIEDFFDFSYGYDWIKLK